MSPGSASILVYGHPESHPDGFDAYFGDLSGRIPGLRRLLHVDCGISGARRLMAHGTTQSLHGWGSALYALAVLPFVKWRPQPDGVAARWRWLVRRAAALENGGGGPAMTRWQMHCQARWLRSARPSAVAWPWENFAWERGLVLAARRGATSTVGYQHTVIGPHQFNYSVRCNADDLESVPDTVVANGPVYLQEMISLGLPETRAVDGGAFRMNRPENGPVFDPDGPVFVALSAIVATAKRQVSAAETLAASGLSVLVKEHPMYPFSFRETERLKRTEIPLAMQKKISSVVYATGATGLDARLLGLPAIRLRLPNAISIDVLPEGIRNPVSSEGKLLDACRNRRRRHRLTGVLCSPR